MFFPRLENFWNFDHRYMHKSKFIKMYTWNVCNFFILRPITFKKINKPLFWHRLDGPSFKNPRYGSFGPFGVLVVEWLYYFPVTTIIYFHKLCSLKQQHCITGKIWMTEVWNQGLGMVTIPLEVPGENNLLPLPASGDCQHSLHCSWTTPISACVHSAASSYVYRVSLCPTLIRTLYSIYCPSDNPR